MREFHQLFVGRTDAYGTYSLPHGQTAKRGTKFVGKAKTVTGGDLTIEEYRAHVRGDTGLGIVPIIPATNSVSWFVIDVDKYGEDDLHGSLAKEITKLNLPLVVCKSKSGGAHLFCFLSEPALAADVLPVARKFAKRLKLDPKVEIFPKQQSIGENDAGSWINLPYFGETRPCMGLDGQTELSLREFLLFANEMECHPSDLDVRLKDLEYVSDPGGSKAPPCIDRMFDEGVEEGGRDNSLTHVAVYLKKRYPDDWQDRVAEFNSTYITPSLKFGDVSRIIKANERRDYQYLCKQQPMCALCDKSACLKREFGVGSGDDNVLDDFTIDSLRKIETEDPIYVLVVDGKPIRLNTDALFDYPVFRKEFFKRCDRVLRPIKPDEWAKRLQEATETMEREKAPEIVGESGQIRHMFREWTEHYITGNKALILTGKPFYSDNNIIFRGSDFLTYLRRQGSRYHNSTVWYILNEDGAEHKRIVVDGSKKVLWVYPVSEPWFTPPSQDGKF